MREFLSICSFILRKEARYSASAHKIPTHLFHQVLASKNVYLIAEDFLIRLYRLFFNDLNFISFDHLEAIFLVMSCFILIIISL